MDGAPEVSVVLPVRNGAATIDEQLAALTRQPGRPSWELIVVDNGSTDDTVARVRSWAPRLPADLRVIDASDAASASVARNVGVQAARAGFLLHCDADDVVGDGWIGCMWEAAQEADLVGGRLGYDRLNTPDLVACVNQTAAYELPSTHEFLPYAPSSNVGYWRYVFDDVDGWDTSFAGVGGEDVDFCWRAQLAGFRLVYVPSAIVHYRLRASLAGMLRQHHAYGRGSLRLTDLAARRGAPVGKRLRPLATGLRLLSRSPALVQGRVQRARFLRTIAFVTGRVRARLERTSSPAAGRAR